MQDAQGENTGVWVFSKEGGGILSGWVTAMMMAGQMRPHFSLGERNGRARSKRDIGGGFRDSPSKPPLKTTERGGCGPLFGNTPSGAAAGPKVGRFDKLPGIKTTLQLAA